MGDAMTEIDLKAFCGDRVDIDHPFSIGEWTYALNGHIGIRVPRRSWYDRTHPNRDAVTNLFAGHELVKFLRAEFPHLPAKLHPKKIECRTCHGTGKEHDCPDCECECNNCEGTGKVESGVMQSIDVNGTALDVEYVRMMRNLPDIRIQSDKVNECEKMMFTFDGGQGVVMALRSPYENHCDVSVTLKMEE